MGEAGRDTDVLVIGGGPAGSTTAIGLARLGHRVVLLERQRFPRAHVGESLPPKIGPLLSILGVGEVIEDAKFTRMAATTVFQGETILTHPFDPTTGTLGYQVDRGRFDHLLLQQARVMGAEVIEGATVDEIEGDLERVRYRVGDERHTIEPNFVVDASGVAAVVAKALDLRERDTIRTVALTGYWKDTNPPQAFDTNDTLFEMMPEGWLWSVQLADGRRNVTLGLDAGTVKSRESLPLDLYLGRVRASRLVGGLVDGASLIDDALVAHDATWSRATSYAGERFLLVGDAAAFIDPLTAHGVFKALQSGITASAVVNTVLRRPDDTPLAVRYFDDMQRRATQNYGSVALTFYRGSPYAAEPFWAKRTRSSLALAAEVDDVYTREGAERRDRFRDDVEHKGGQRVSLKARPTLSLMVVPSAEGVFVVERPALVGPTQARVDIPAALSPAPLYELLDGRTMAEVFDGYAAATLQQPSRNLGRALMIALSTLVERGLVEVAIDQKIAY